MKGTGIISWVVFVGLFGVLVPWHKGYEFLDPLLLVPYFCLSILFVAPMVSDLVSSDPERASRGITVGLAAGWGSGLLIVALGLATVNAAHGHRLLLPAASLLAAAAAISLAGSAAAATASALIALRSPSAASARRILRIGFFSLLLAIAAARRMLPDAWRDRVAGLSTASGLIGYLWCSTLALALVAAILFFVLRPRLRHRY